MAAAGVVLAVISQTLPTGAQVPPRAPAVGVIKAAEQPITETNEFIGRVQAINIVDIVARITGFVEGIKFSDGAEVKKGEVLYLLESGPFEADLDAKRAVADQMQAQLDNAQVSLDRAAYLLKSQTGSQSTYDSALATQRSFAAQLLGANANVKSAEINLAYTKIVSPIDGKTGRTSMTIGNVVGPNTGVLVSVVGQDPMYVTFPIAFRTALELRTRYADKGGFDAVRVKLRLPDGRVYGEIGKLDFADNKVQTATDTIVLRATIPNPLMKQPDGRVSTLRELFDSEFVTVLLEGVAPVNVLGVPRAAILSDQQGDFVYVVDDENKVQRRTVQLGQSTPTVASVVSGLKAGEMVIVEGLQRVRPGLTVSPGPAAASPVPAIKTGQ